MSDDPIMSALADLKAGQSGIRDEITRTRANIMERIDRLQDAVTAIRDDIAVNMGAADAMQKANDNTRELVRLQGEQLSIMWEQLKQAQQDIRELKGTP